MISENINPSQLTLVQAYHRYIKKPFSFSGRISRSEYNFVTWLAPLVYGLFCLIILALGSRVTILVSSPGQTLIWPMATAVIINLIVLIICAISMMGYMVRRLHDMGNKGWWILINLIPVIGSLIYLYKSLQPSQKGDNSYGPQPNETLPINPACDENDMTLCESFLRIIKGTFNFKGRTTRHVFFLGMGALYFGVSVIQAIGGALIDGIYGAALIKLLQVAPFLLSDANMIEAYVQSQFGAPLAGIYAVVLLLFALAYLCTFCFIAAGVRRLHDIGRSGWWVLLGFVPLLNLIFWYFMIQPSSADTTYGPQAVANQAPANDL